MLKQAQRQRLELKMNLQQANLQSVGKKKQAEVNVKV
jgi:hypothetical protein